MQQHLSKPKYAHKYFMVDDDDVKIFINVEKPFSWANLTDKTKLQIKCNENMYCKAQMRNYLSFKK